MSAKIKLWGVRGSVPGSTENMKNYGCNSSCITIHNDKTLIILDAGSGLVSFGYSNIDFSSYDTIHIFFSHYHYDHIIGFPFFNQIFYKSRRFRLYGPTLDGFTVEDSIKGLLKRPYLPFDFSMTQAKFEFVDMIEPDEIVIDDFVIRCTATDHPGGNLAYTISHDNNKFSYITDLGHSGEIHGKLVEFVMNSKYIYYDSHFTEKEYFSPIFEGWGHSHAFRGFRLQEDSNSQTLLLAHHAPGRKSEELESLEDHYKDKNIIVARENSEFIL